MLTNRYIRLGEASRKVWTHPDLAQEFAELVAYRDRLYALHRHSAPARG